MATEKQVAFANSIVSGWIKEIDNAIARINREHEQGDLDSVNAAELLEILNDYKAWLSGTVSVHALAIINAHGRKTTAASACFNIKVDGNWLVYGDKASQNRICDALQC